MSTTTEPRGLHLNGGAIAWLSVALAVSSLAACGRSAGTSATTGAIGASAPPTAAATTPAGASLPTLPPFVDGKPQSFDAQGCLVDGSPGADRCTTTAAQLDAQRAGSSVTDWRDLAGFSGNLYTTDLRRGAVVVLVDSVSVATSGGWAARGLARNETAASVGALSITADLVGADGVVLERVTAPSLVRDVRPGEPAPFVLTATTTDATSVASVNWSAGGDAAAASGSRSRSFEIATYWTRPAGGRPMEGRFHKDNGDNSSHVVFGSLTDVGGATAGAEVVAAWLDRSGRVLAVAQADALGPGDVASTRIDAAGMAQFLLLVPGPSAAALADLTPMLWAMGR